VQAFDFFDCGYAGLEDIRPAREGPTAMVTALEERTILPPEDRGAERQQVTQLAELLASVTDGRCAALTTAEGTSVELPEEVCGVLQAVVAAMSNGLAITVAPQNTLLTTQEAADMLSISRPTLVRLLGEGEMPYEQRGRHRRVRLADVLEYRERMRRERRARLDEMASEGQHAGLYEATLNPAVRTR
jgi:excisionase family DNA binding protein